MTKDKKLKKYAASKQRYSSRKEDNSYWIYGIHPCLSALNNNNRTCLRLLITKSTLISSQINKSYDFLDIEVVDQEKIRAVLPTGTSHQGIAIKTLPLPSITLSKFIKTLNTESTQTLLALDQVNDPRNIGAILRTASAFGVKATIVPNQGTPNESGAMCKAAAGSMETMTLLRVPNLVRAIRELKKIGFWVTGIENNRGTDLSNCVFSKKSLLILGAEANGIRRLTREQCDYFTHISISNEIDSLNISNAAAIALYESSKQKNQFK